MPSVTVVREVVGQVYPRTALTIVGWIIMLTPKQMIVQLLLAFESPVPLQELPKTLPLDFQ